MNLRRLVTEDDLKTLIANKIQEDLHLDYKQCAALCRKDSSTAEATKDASSFANSDGGQIVYGIIEDKHFPTAIDSGFDPAEISKEWLEDILTSGIRPRIPDLSIKQIILQSTGNNRVAYVVDIPKSYSGPHQAKDRRYYKRFNFKSEPMEDYEIRDVVNRRAVPQRPFVLIDVMAVEFALYLVVKNLGDIPAEHIKLSISPQLPTISNRDPAQYPIFRNGIRYLTKEKSYFLMLGSAHQLVKESNPPFTVDVEYRYLEHYVASDHFEINLSEFIGTVGEPSTQKVQFDRTIEQLKKTSDQLQKIASSIDSIKGAFEMSGLSLSYGTLHSFLQKNESPFLVNLRRMQPEDFAVLFKLDSAKAWKVYEYFLVHNEASEKQLVDLGLSEDEARQILNRSICC